MGWNVLHSVFQNSFLHLQMFHSDNKRTHARTPQRSFAVNSAKLNAEAFIPGQETEKEQDG